ncbi:hypothetical protein [Actinacidiphila alni]|uniref:hypothetical protein n=1 Tax=Actinacidiphila alni TaxID=380248 RepID=UPI0011603CB3|nr:hypothetical protein [Actinacidiphila alni]
MTSPTPSGPPPPLLSLRSALVLLLGTLSGIFTALLSVLGDARTPTAILVGLGTVAPAVIFFNQIIS